MRRAAWASASVVVAAVLAVSAHLHAATSHAALVSTSLTSQGKAVELRFDFRGTAPRWELSGHSQELWIDLPGTLSRVPPRPVYGQEVAPISAVRVFSDDAGGVRIVIRVDGKIDYAIARLGHRIVLRIASSGAVPNLAAALLTLNEPRRVARSAPSAVPRYRATAPPAIPTAREIPEQLATGRTTAPGHPLVVIDPGHGGKDPGTSSSDGIEEKTLALEIAIRLKNALAARGIDTELTRSSDVFIPLAGRTHFANAANADLFVSIHLNSSPNPQTAGIEVYYLNNTTDRATIRLARMENHEVGRGYGAADEPNLNYILTDLRQQYKANEAASLARMIDAQTAADLDAQFGINVDALGAKMGPFYVLVGARMPAVLVECGFLSNQVEAHRLASAGYQQVLAGGIAQAIVHYLNADAAVGNL